MKIATWWSLIAFTGMMGCAAAGPMPADVKLRIRDGHPIVDGVYVNGQGPFRFLVDTGTNVNLIQTHLAQSIGLVATFRSELAASGGVVVVPGKDGNEIALESLKESGQMFLFMGLEAIQERWPDVQGVLGQSFLSRFDYTLDLRRKLLEFGDHATRGTRVPFALVNGRQTVVTSLGRLVLDSGADRLVLFGVKPDIDLAVGRELHTVAGPQEIGILSSRSLTIAGRKIWRGDAVVARRATESGVDGLMPLSFFNVIYVCNSEGYLVLE